ncbi:MAG: hypothetical protein R2724_29055 [Bryobacterales bacterium]
MYSTLVRHRVEPDTPPPPNLPDERKQQLARQAALDARGWQTTAPGDSLRRLGEAFERLERRCERARQRYESDNALSSAELWFVENRRLLESVGKELAERFRELVKLPRKDASRNLLAVQAASSYLDAVRLELDREGWRFTSRRRNKARRGRCTRSGRSRRRCSSDCSSGLPALPRRTATSAPPLRRTK